MKGKVLIVDDDPVLLTLMEEKLRKAGYEVQSTRDGLEALEKVREAEPEIIVSDIMMPTMDGYELHRRLRQAPDTASIPFLFLSAKSEPAEQLQGLRLGADDYVCKPFEIQELVDRMESVMKRVAKARSYNSEADFGGALNRMSIADILQIVEINHKTGKLVLKNPKCMKTGSASFEKGCLIDAEMGKLKGEEAFYGLIAEKQGFFEFFRTNGKLARTIDSPNMALLLNGARFLDEAEDLPGLIPDYSVRLKVKSHEVAPGILNKIGDEIIDHVFAMVEKGLTVEQMLTPNRYSASKTAAALCQLIKANILGSEKSGPPAKPRIEKRLLLEIEKAHEEGLTGMLVIENRPEKAVVYFDKGQIVNACTGKLFSRKALYRILSKTGGEVEFSEGPVTVSKNIKSPLAKIIMGAEKEMEELDKLDKTFFKSSVIVNVNGTESIAQLEQKQYLKQVLNLARQHEFVDDILEASPNTDLATCKALIQLKKLKAVRIDCKSARKDC